MICVFSLDQLCPTHGPIVGLFVYVQHNEKLLALMSDLSHENAWIF